MSSGCCFVSDGYAVLGLDMRFLGRKREKKNKDKGKGN
jgi:hypothetical protein